MGTLDTSESQNNFVILFLLGSSPRLSSYHGIWTQHDGSHLPGRKQKCTVFSESESSTDSWEHFSASGGGGHCRTVSYRQILLDEPSCRTEPWWVLYYIKSQLLESRYIPLLNFLTWSCAGRTKFLSINQTSSYNSHHWISTLLYSVVILFALFLLRKISPTKEMGILDHLTCLLRNLYAGQEATVRTDMNNRLVLNRKRSTSRLYIVTLLI